ncbi:MAG TPA: hypothetical protein VIK33_13495 [Anaerolineae bacterium]
MSETTVYCYYHPDTPTTLRCNRCNKPICWRDAVRTPTGYRCKTCVRQQQDIFFNATPIDYVVTAGVALFVGYLGQRIVPQLGWFLIFLAPVIGGIAGEVIWQLSRKRRGRYVWIVALASLGVGALFAVLPKLQFMLAAGNPLGLLWDLVYFGLAAAGVFARLKIWRG